jgi:hypothetical protein
VETWWTDLKVIWWLLGLAAAAGIMVWRTNHHEKWLLDLDKRVRGLENWRSQAEEKLRHLEDD